MLRLLTLIAALLVALAGGAERVSAQDASPAASPAAGPCDAPALPPGTPTPMEEEAPPAGTPADDMAGMEMGTPEAVEEAEEVAEVAEEVAEATPETAMAATPAGTPATGADADAATAAAENLANCLNGGDAEGFAALLTPNFMQNLAGTTNPYDVVAGFGEIPPLGVREIGNAQSYDDGRVSVDLVHTGFTAFGPNQVNNTRLYFVEEGDYRLLDAYESLPVAGADTTVDAEMVDYAFVLSQNTVAAGELVAFNVINAGQYPHELVVVQLPEGATVDQVLAGEVPEEQIVFYGVNFAGPGGNASFALENLEPGSYTLVCFVDEPEGVPHVARGMIAEFTVE